MRADRTVLLLDVMDTLVYDPFFEDMPRFFGMSLAEMLGAKHPTSWAEFEKGEISQEQMFERFFADGRSFDHQGLLALVEQRYRWVEGMEELLTRLNRRGVPMHLLSNYPTWSRIIETKLGLSRFASWRFVSWKTGKRKPDPEAYLGTARALETPVEHCLFVDDRQGNCDAARALGMPAHLFKDAASFAEDLQRRELL